MRVHVVVIGHSQGHLHIPRGHGDLAWIAIRVIALDTIANPSVIALTCVVFSVRPKLDIEQTFSLAVALVNVETVSWNRVAVSSIASIPASVSIARVGTRVSSRTTLSPTRGTPCTIRPAGVPEAGVARGGEGPVVGWDSKAARLSSLFFAGAPFLHGSSTLNSISCAAGAVRPVEVKPTWASFKNSD